MNRVTIAQIGKVITGKTPKTKQIEYWNGGVSFVTPGDLQNTKHILSTDRTISKEGLLSVKSCALPTNAICVSCIGNLGYIGLTTAECISNQQINSVVPNKDFDPDYVYYLFKSLWPFFKSYEGQSTALSILNKGQFSNIEVSVHDFAEQQEIGRKLSLYDDKIENNNKISSNLREQIMLIFNKLFLGPQSESWAEDKVGNYLKLERGLSYKGKYLTDSSEIAMVNLGNIMPNSIFREEKIKFYCGDYAPRNVVKPGDVVIANTDLTQAREVLGSAIFIPDLGYKTMIASHHLSIVRNLKISKYYLYGLLNSPTFRKRVAGYATGTTVLALPADALLNCSFRIPPKALIDKFDSIVAPMFELLENNESENRKLSTIRDTLISKMFKTRPAFKEIE